MKKKMLERKDAPEQDTKQKNDKETVVVAKVHEDGERTILELAIYKENQLFARHFLVLFVNLFDADLFNLFGSINLHFSQISQ